VPRCSPPPLRHVVTAKRATSDEALRERRLALTVDQHGHVVAVDGVAQPQPLATAVGASPQPPIDAAAAVPAAVPTGPFGFPPAVLLGRRLYEAVDVLAALHDEGRGCVPASLLHQRATASRTACVSQSLGKKERKKERVSQ
jgi:hypothetical protein